MASCHPGCDSPLKLSAGTVVGTAFLDAMMPYCGAEKNDAYAGQVKR